MEYIGITDTKSNYKIPTLLCHKLAKLMSFKCKLLKHTKKINLSQKNKVFIKEIKKYEYDIYTKLNTLNKNILVSMLTKVIIT